MSNLFKFLRKGWIHRCVLLSRRSIWGGNQYKFFNVHYQCERHDDM